MKLHKTLATTVLFLVIFYEIIEFFFFLKIFFMGENRNHGFIFYFSKSHFPFGFGFLKTPKTWDYFNPSPIILSQQNLDLGLKHAAPLGLVKALIQSTLNA